MWSLQRAAPILLQRLSAYTELARQDMERSRAHIVAGIGRLLLLATALLLTLMMTCAAIVAASWDTAHRMTTIYCLLAVLVMSTCGAALWCLNTWRQRPAPFAGVRREWQADQALLERLLADPPPEEIRPDSDGDDEQFPRSATMKWLTSGRTAGALSLLAIGFFATRPAMAGRWLRFLPLGSMARTAIVRLFNAPGEQP